MIWKIMIVDDYREMRTVLRVAFECAGFEVIEAPNGLAAIEKVKALQPHLILMDVRMPRMDGFTACQIIRNTKETAHIPIIHLTDETCQEHKDKSVNSGANCYLPKPMFPFELVDKVSKLLRNHYHVSGEENSCYSLSGATTSLQ